MSTATVARESLSESVTHILCFVHFNRLTAEVQCGGNTFNEPVFVKNRQYFLVSSRVYDGRTRIVRFPKTA